MTLGQCTTRLQGECVPRSPGNGRCSQKQLGVAEAVGRAQVSSLWLAAGWWRKEGTAEGAGRG